MTIDRNQAIEIARTRAAEKGWPFAEPLALIIRRAWFGGVSRFEIETGAGKRGTHTRFVIDAKTGEIVSEGYVPR